MRFANTSPPIDGVYVTHMRRYDPEGVLGSMDEVFRIGREAGVPVHISHFNSRAELVLPKIDAGRADGIDVTYDLYCYLAGSTILGMAALPPEIQEGGVAATLRTASRPRDSPTVEGRVVCQAPRAAGGRPPRLRRRRGGYVLAAIRRLDAGGRRP